MPKNWLNRKPTTPSPLADFLRALSASFLLELIEEIFVRDRSGDQAALQTGFGALLILVASGISACQPSPSALRIQTATRKLSGLLYGQPITRPWRNISVAASRRYRSGEKCINHACNISHISTGA